MSPQEQLTQTPVDPEESARLWQQEQDAAAATRQEQHRALIRDLGTPPVRLVMKDGVIATAEEFANRNETVPAPKPKQNPEETTL